MTTGWGILGLGAHAEHRLGPAINKASNIKFVAVCSRNLERAKNFANTYRVKNAYDSLSEMLEDPELDVVCIATPHSLHAGQTIKSAEAGKHVLCEKPMALTVADCERMIEACNVSGVKLGIDFQNRYHPAHIEARRLLQTDIIGSASLARVQYCTGHLRGYWQGWRNVPDMTGSGALVAMGIHAIDLIQFLLDSSVKEVRAFTDEEPPRYPIDDMVYVILRLENMVTTLVTSGILAPFSDNDVVLYGSEAKLTCKGTVGTVLQGELLVEGNSVNIRMTFPTDDPVLDLYIRTIEDFNKCIEQNHTPSSSGYEGLQMVKIANAIVESSRQGRAITIAK